MDKDTKRMLIVCGCIVGLATVAYIVSWFLM